MPVLPHGVVERRSQSFHPRARQRVVRGHQSISLHHRPRDGGVQPPREKIHEFRDGEGAEMVQWLARCERAIGDVYAPDGVNVGANVGRSAGAGVVGHFHIHLVPRWQGDTNFMSSVGETRVVSEDLNDTYQKLRRALGE